MDYRDLSFDEFKNIVELFNMEYDSMDYVLSRFDDIEEFESAIDCYCHIENIESDNATHLRSVIYTLLEELDNGHDLQDILLNDYDNVKYYDGTYYVEG